LCVVRKEKWGRIDPHEANAKALAAHNHYSVCQDSSSPRQTYLELIRPCGHLADV